MEKRRELLGKEEKRNAEEKRETHEKQKKGEKKKYKGTRKQGVHKDFPFLK